MALFKNKKSAKKAGKKTSTAKGVDKKKPVSLIRDSGFYTAIKPKNRYYFFSDYFEIDEGASYGTVLTVFANDGTDAALYAFWGSTLALMNLGPEFNDVRIRFLSQSRRRSQTWIEAHKVQAERVVNSDVTEGESFSKGERTTVAENSDSLDTISEELRNNASYLDVRMKYLVKAPSVARLDAATLALNRELRERFNSVEAVPYDGSQRFELSTLLRSTMMKDLRQFGFTSDEFAGFYNLVTNGINDDTGEYVGIMEGDVNNAAILFDVDNYKGHVVIASDRKAWLLQHETDEITPSGTALGGDLWGVKLGQEALKNNHRVVHFVLNNANIEEIGLDLSPLTARVNMDSGDLNMFEIFGDPEQELALMDPQIEKITLMALLVSGKEVNDDASSLRVNLARELQQFYIDNGMWAENAKDPRNRQYVNLVGLPHDEYPMLHDFKMYFSELYRKLAEGGTNEPNRLAAAETLMGTFDRMVSSSGDLFDVVTSDAIDDADRDSRVIYSFTKLRQRGENIAMAQFVNVLGYAVRSLVEGDLVVLHGAERIREDLKPYIEQQFEILREHGVRIVYIYNDAEKMLDDAEFNRLDRADYTLMSNLTAGQVEQYADVLHTQIPSNLEQCITSTERDVWYLRRTYENVVFSPDFSIGLDVDKVKGGGLR